jgi:hypothetical protein
MGNDHRIALGLAIALWGQVARAEDVGSFGMVSLLRSSSSGAAPSSWPDPPVEPRRRSIFLLADSIEDAAGGAGLSLSSAGVGGAGPVGPAVGARSAITDLAPGLADAKAHRLRDHVARGAAKAENRLPGDTIQSIVRANVGHVEECYGSGLRENPALEGRVVVKFVVGGAGSVLVATDAGSDLPDATVVACVVRVLDALAFPASGGGPVTVVYPFSLSPPSVRVRTGVDGDEAHGGPRLLE